MVSSAFPSAPPPPRGDCGRRTLLLDSILREGSQPLLHRRPQLLLCSRQSGGVHLCLLSSHLRRMARFATVPSSDEQVVTVSLMTSCGGRRDRRRGAPARVRRRKLGLLDHSLYYVLWYSLGLLWILDPDRARSVWRLHKLDLCLQPCDRWGWDGMGWDGMERDVNFCKDRLNSAAVSHPPHWQVGLAKL